MLRIFKRNNQESLKQTEEGVKASRDRWFGRILGILRSSRLDDSVWEELEEVLISSDVGVDTSLRVIENLKVRVKYDHLEDPEAVFQALRRRWPWNWSTKTRLLYGWTNQNKPPRT